MSGWIKIHRNIINHWLYTEKRVFSKFEAWNDILLTVNYFDNKTVIKGILYEVKRGQSILSLDSWSKRWNWDKSKVRRFFKTLQDDQMIVIKSDTVTTHLTVCNYESYQSETSTSETQMKRKRNADETQTTLIKERKKERKKEELNTILSDSIINQNFEKNTIDYEFYFNLFWDAYDKKYGKSKSFDKFKKIKPELYDLIIDKATEYKKSTPDIQFRKNPLTWLNGQHWEDEIVINKTKNNETGSKSDQYMDALFNLANRYKNS